jgi:hypothetical protein
MKNGQVRFGVADLAMVLVSLTTAVHAADTGPITTRSLLSDMTDLVGLAEFPAPAYACRQFSSYDRASKSPTENWFANGDCGQYLRTETTNGRQEFVMMDADGPGAIVRIWSANPAGTLRLYLDAAETPALEAKMEDLLGGKFPGLPRPIAGEYSKGWNLYFPIPYATHCKVTSDQGNFYYHVNYRTYAAGTAVETFTADTVPQLRAEMERTMAKLAETGATLSEAQVQSGDFTAQPGQATALATIAGSQMVRYVEVAWSPSGDRDEPALRSCLIEMTFDGETTVAAPLGDFFGTSPGLNAYQSRPLDVRKHDTHWSLSSRWAMPCQRSAEVRVRNLGQAPVSFQATVVSMPYTWTDRSMLFHAKWRGQFDVPTEPKIDWNYLTASGQGVFAGVAFSIDNPVRDWWGEGDEKITIDGEGFPSHFGTGTEDYYGYAWCFPALFTHPYHNQTRCDGPGNYGRTSVNRWHILDRIPFTNDFRFDMELWHWKNCKVNLGVTTYWYARPGSTDGFTPIAAGDLMVRPLPAYAAPKVKDAIEGETMQILKQTGTPAPQEWAGASGESHLWWHGGQQPGDTLVLGFPVETAGKYKVTARFLKAVDYGIAQLALNDTKAGEPIDFYNDGVILWGPVELGTFELKAGQNTVAFSIVGANPKAVKAYMTGLDYLLLTPVP